VARLSITIEGIVQGVGFRPFVHTSATRHGLSGWVSNDADGVHVEVEGDEGDIGRFLSGLTHPPPAARIDRIVTKELPNNGDAGLPSSRGFVIRESTAAAMARPTLPADQATCADCAEETETPSERRYLYPFTNCTICGPRYTIIEALPYDRLRTSMKQFPMCEACAREYENPSDRRFHAQPIACPTCGPTVTLIGSSREVVASRESALQAAAGALCAGRILALKGLGGYQLLCDATSEDAVVRLRERKGREEKPLAVMFPSLQALHGACVVSSEEERATLSSEAPILLVRRREEGQPVVAPAVAPGTPRLGVMLPYTPLHRLLLARVGRPLVCTSGNLSEEPMCIAEEEAFERLGRLADLFLVHNRMIVRPVDDSVARVGPVGLELLRRARGFAPLPLPLAGEGCVLALGGQLKNTVALANGGQVVVSQHVGDLSSIEGTLLCARVADDLVRFFGARPDRVACDLHPDYASTRLAEQLAAHWSVPLVRVQHHHAHIAACMAEHSLSGPVLGLAWDGSGLGADGTVWGGEALVIDGARFRRVAHLRPFSLPGNERAVREPRRAAAGVLYEIFQTNFPDYLTPHGTSDSIIIRMLERGLNSPRTTSIGRLFDAVAAMTGVCTQVSFEGQAAMALEHVAEGIEDDAAYPLPLGAGHPAIADWEPLVRALQRDLQRGTGKAVLAARFHNALVNLAEDIANHVGLRQVVLSGGCFQNLRLAAATRQRLSKCGFEVFAPRLYPPNDGGLSLGQAFVARAGE
jgi:hydrogenase maturation protein HypF